MVSFHDVSGGDGQDDDGSVPPDFGQEEFRMEGAKAVVHQMVAMTSHIRRMNSVKQLNGHSKASLQVLDDVIEICELQVEALRRVLLEICGSEERTMQVFDEINEPISEVIRTLNAKNN